VQFDFSLPSHSSIVIVARHSSEKYSSIKVLLGIGILLEALGLDVGIARLITTYLMELPNSRQQELEGTF
jgi:metalloendopeptidase OMA1, mitochondrial